MVGRIFGEDGGAAVFAISEWLQGLSQQHVRTPAVENGGDGYSIQGGNRRMGS